MADTLSIVIVITLLGSVVAALGLYALGNQRGRVEVKPTIPAAGVGTAEVSSAILNQLRNLPASAQDQSRVAGAIAGVVAVEVERQKAAMRQTYEVKLQEQGRELAATTQKAQQLGQEYKATYEKYQRVNAEKTQTESIVRSIAEGLVVVNNKGEVLLMNPAAEQLLGVEKTQKLGKPLSSEVREGALISMVKDAGAGREIELNSQDESTKKVLRASTAVIENENGQTVGMVSLITDITKQKEVEGLKAKFLSTVSQEIRTPIVTIQKALAIIHEQSAGPLTETQEKFLTIAERNLGSLSHLIDDLLDMAKLEAGKMKMAFERAAIGDAVRQVVENLEPWARSKGLTLAQQVPGDVPPLDLDLKRIGQVLTNLVGNAIKFTPQGGRITVEARRREAVVEVSVTDTGIGITKEDLGKVFDRFQQVGERVATDVSGTGLGLSIAKEIVELHKGKIWVESEPKKGTSFRFSLPIPAGQPKG